MIVLSYAFEHKNEDFSLKIPLRLLGFDEKYAKRKEGRNEMRDFLPFLWLNQKKNVLLHRNIRFGNHRFCN